MEEKIPLSVVILTKNSQEMVEDCLKSVFGWVEEIIVVDDMSIDRTKEIVKKYTDKIFIKKWIKEGVQRNFAYSQAKNTWVLTLDPDERVTLELKKELEEIFTNNNIEFSGFSVSMKTYLGEHWIRWGGWYVAKLKIFRKDKFRYEEAEIHPRAFLEGKEGRLKADIIHLNYQDFSQYIEKTNIQSTLEAKKWLRDKRKMNFFIASLRTVDRFVRMFFRKKGYRDGFLGFMVAYISGLYQILSYAKYWELKKKKL
jgi:glycosyltransferase involved in cell wall biosynthesis